MSQYPKVVEASVIGSRSSHAIAIALAVEIPAGAPEIGRKVAEARAAAIAARGEVRSNRTWQEWRELALYAECSFADTSLHEHRKAKEAGIPIAELRANPRARADRLARAEAEHAAREEAGRVARRARNEAASIVRPHEPIEIPVSHTVSPSVERLASGPSAAREPVEPLGSYAAATRAEAGNRLRVTGQVTAPAPVSFRVSWADTIGRTVNGILDNLDASDLANPDECSHAAKYLRDALARIERAAE